MKPSRQRRFTTREEACGCRSTFRSLVFSPNILWCQDHEYLTKDGCCDNSLGFSLAVAPVGNVPVSRSEAKQHLSLRSSDPLKNLINKYLNNRGTNNLVFTHSKNPLNVPSNNVYSYRKTLVNVCSYVKLTFQDSRVHSSSLGSFTGEMQYLWHWTYNKVQNHTLRQPPTSIVIIFGLRFYVATLPLSGVEVFRPTSSKAGTHLL